MLDALVADDGGSANQVIKQAIRDLATRRGLAVRADEAFASSEARWATLIDRLARA
jgi:hypothetical protein